MTRKALVMFSPEDRSRIRLGILERARQDPRIGGAAMTGSAALDREDRWSDIDLAFGVNAGTETEDVLTDWTAYMYAHHGALHHVDVRAGAWVYRVFLLPDTLQIDLAFAPADEFKALAPTFRLIFGSSAEPRYAPPPRANEITGMGWLYALHARSSLARGKWWQAEYMISGLRDHALALACIRRELPALHGRGFDQLPKEDIADLERSFVNRLTREDLIRAFGVVLQSFVTEIRKADTALADRLALTLVALNEWQTAV